MTSSTPQKSPTTSYKSPVITSFLDTDAYKLHMQQAVFHQNRDVHTSFEFNCRNSDDFLGVYADEIRGEINRMSEVILSDEEFDYLSTLPHFQPDYLEFLKSYRYKPEQVNIRVVPCAMPGGAPNASFGESGSQLAVTVEGPWVETILWEIPLLATISEVVHRARHPHVGVADAVEKLNRKLDVFLEKHSAEELSNFKISDFGTRRRYSQAVQEAIVRTLHEDARFSAHLVGTSNYDLARRLGVPAIGTQAHEWFQGFQQLSPTLRHSQTMALEMWLKEYPNVLGIALTDCITMDAFLNDFTKDLAAAYQGLRQDSGDPVEWGRKAIAHYTSMGIDSRTKTLVFSDGLNLDSAVALYNTFKAEAKIMCGIGTQLTCSLDGVRPLNIVVKMVRCQGRPVAKVSDSPGKGMCQDVQFVEKLMEVFNVRSPVTREGQQAVAAASGAS